MKILVVEDDQPVAQALYHLLSSYHYAVDTAEDAEAGLRMLDAFEYDLLLLDIVLPGLDGVSLCQRVRQQGLHVPILLLTGKDESHQKAIALNGGADDYVVKPFDTEELIARVQALLRRGGSKTQPILSWGNLCVDPSHRQVTYSTHIITTTPKEYAILELFLRNPHSVFSSRALLDQVWSSEASPGEEAVRVHIKELRKKFRAIGAPNDLIKTVHGSGYRLNPLYTSDSMTDNDEMLTPVQIAALKAENVELRSKVIDMQRAQSDWNTKYQTLEEDYRRLKQILGKKPLDMRHSSSERDDE